MIALILMLACDGGTDDGTDKAPVDTATTDTTDAGTTDDTDSTATDDTGAALDPFCDDAPVVTWENWGEGFMVERCSSCHAASSAERNGAPDAVNFDTHDEAVALSDRVLARTVDVGDMPPSGGVTADDLYLLEVWLSCWEDPQPGTGVNDGDDSTPDPEEDDEPYLSDDTDVDLPSFDAEAVGAALGAAMTDARQISAVPVVAGYFEATAGMDETCPGWLNFDGTEYWYDYCTTLDGTTFDGYGAHVLFEDYPLGDGNYWDGYQISSLGSVTTPAGDVFEAAGAAYVLWTEASDGGLIYQSYVEGGFSYDGPAAAGTWLEDNLSPTLSTYAIAYPGFGPGADDGNAIVLSGQVLVEDASVAAVVFEELFIYDETLGSPCPSEPDGMISVLNTSGVWVDLVFDGGQWGEAVDPAVCDGCGSAWYQGNLLGEVCADFSGLTDWGTNPWE